MAGGTFHCTWSTPTPSVRLNSSLRERFLAALDSQLAEERREWNPDRVHRSDLDRCIRASYYQYSNEEAEHTPNTLMLFLRGRIVHTLLQAGGALEYEEVIDGIVSHVDERFLGADIEKKTTTSKYAEPPDFATETEKNGEVKRPWGVSWLMEIAYVAAKRADRKANFMVLHLNGDYAENRNVWMLAGPYEYEFTEEECQQARDWYNERAAALRTAMSEGQPPSVKYRLGDWECKRKGVQCPFLHLCAE